MPIERVATSGIFSLDGGDHEVLVMDAAHDHRPILVLQVDAVVHTGHGPDPRIGDEGPHLEEWILRAR